MATSMLGDLTREQMSALTQAVQAHERVELTRMRVEADQAVLSRAVYDALAQGVPATLVAAELGLSVARVYQLKSAITDQT